MHAAAANDKRALRLPQGVRRRRERIAVGARAQNAMSPSGAKTPAGNQTLRLARLAAAPARPGRNRRHRASSPRLAAAKKATDEDSTMRSQ